MYHFPGFHYIHNLPQAERLEHSLRRYLTRKIGFESVMRIRCTHGLAIHTFHGNFFVRSTDLLSLPNINPDAGFGLQVSIEESLSEVQNVCFQAALLYTSSKGRWITFLKSLFFVCVSKLISTTFFNRRTAYSSAHYVLANCEHSSRSDPISRPAMHRGSFS